MEYFYFRTQIYNSVTEKLTKEYGLGNLNFEMGDLLVEEIIGSIWENTQSGLDRNESFEKTFSEFHDRITDIRPLTHGYIISFSTDANDCIPYAWHVSVFRGLSPAKARIRLSLVWLWSKATDMGIPPVDMDSQSIPIRDPFHTGSRAMRNLSSPAGRPLPFPGISPQRASTPRYRDISVSIALMVL